MTDGTGTSSYGYDGLGDLTSETDGAGATVGYRYDPDGNQTAIVYPGNEGTVGWYEDGISTTGASLMVSDGWQF